MLYDPNWAPATEIELKPWQKVLLDAADLIEKQGWCQANDSWEGKHCAVGAICAVNKETLFSGEVAKQKLVEHLATTVPMFVRACGEGVSIELWNDLVLDRTTGAEIVVATMREVAKDKHGRTKQEVITMMREAAKS